MATIGRTVPQSAWDVFDGLRTFDAKKASGPLADDAVWVSPWSGRLEGKEAIASWLESFLGDVDARTSMTVRDVDGDRALTRFSVSVSGRFGRSATPMMMQVLYLRGKVHQVVIA